MAHIAGSHHATLSVGGAQEDVDFHTDTLGMRFIKKTVLYDGSLPIYHLYYSNANGDASSVVTTFPFRQAGIKGRRGTNQARELHLAVPAASLDFWSARLASRGVEVQDAEVLDQRRLLLRHPSGSSTPSWGWRVTRGRATPAATSRPSTRSTASTASACTSPTPRTWSSS